MVPKKCGGTRLHRHRQWSGRVERGGDVPQQAPPHPRADPDHRPRPAYAKPPLSKAYLCGRQAKLDLHSPGWFVRHDVELQRGITVDHIDLARQEVVTEGGRRYPYWHLVLGCGANAVPLRVPGAEAALTLRSFADAVILRMAARSADSAVVIGGGLIACEAAACLAGRGVPTTMVAAEPVPLQRRFGDRVGERVAKILSDNGVRFLGSTTVTAIDDTRVHLDTGATLDGDLVVSATGVRPDPHLAEAVGLDTEDGRIVVDEHMHTSALNVYAAGDVALAYNVTAGGASAPSTGATPPSRVSSPGCPRPATPRHGTRCPDSLAP